MFHPHGQFILSQQDNIIRVDASGPFNHEAVQCYQKDITAVLKDMQGAWGQLIIMHQNCLYTPQAEERMHQFSKRRKTLGLQAIALVFLDIAPLFIVRDKIADFYLHADIPCAFFTRIEEAEQWLTEQLNTMSSTVEEDVLI